MSAWGAKINEWDLSRFDLNYLMKWYHNCKLKARESKQFPCYCRRHLLKAFSVSICQKKSISISLTDKFSSNNSKYKNLVEYNNLFVECYQYKYSHQHFTWKNKDDPRS